jgi:hypothetical protein
MQFEVKSQSAKHGQDLIQLDRRLSVLKRVYESLGDAREIRQLILAQAKVTPPGPDSVAEGRIRSIRGRCHGLSPTHPARACGFRKHTATNGLQASLIRTLVRIRP